MSCHSYNDGLLVSRKTKLGVKEVPDLPHTINAIHHRHAEVGEDHGKGDAKSVRTLDLLKSFLAINAEVNLVVNVNLCPH